MEILTISNSLKTFSVLDRERPTGTYNQISAFSPLKVCLSACQYYMYYTTVYLEASL